MVDLAELTAKRDEIRTQVEVASLQAELNLLDQQKAFVREAHEQQDWAVKNRQVQEGHDGQFNLVNRTEFLTDGVGLSNFGNLVDARISRPSDRKNGDNWPFWRTEIELSQIRGISRFIGATDEVGGSALENLTNYVIGQGFTIDAQPKNPKDKEARKLAAKVQRIIDLFIDENDWEGDGERELFTRSRRDGEFYLLLQHRGGPHVEARNVDPTFVSEPADVRKLEDHLKLEGLDWKYGHAKEPNNPQRQFGVFVSWFGSDTDWDFVKPTGMVNGKINVDSEVTRGLSDYYPVWQNLQASEKLLKNTLAGSAVQAAIAYIREHTQGTSGDSINELVNARKDSTFRLPNQFGGRDVNARRSLPGTIVDVAKGAKYHAGPLGQPRGQSYIDVVQAALRIVGVRWQMPEYMISGDASNGNFASTLVSEAPFTKSCEAKQSFYVRKWRTLFWKVVAMAAAWIGVPFRTIKRVLELIITPPVIAVRDKLEDHTIRTGEHEAGVLSLETWAEEVGRDFEQEQKRGAGPVAEPTSGDIQESRRQLWLGYP